MQRVNDFFNKLSSDIHNTYFPNENHGYTQNKKYHAANYSMELFNNGCLTMNAFVTRLAKNCTDTKENVEKIVNKYFLDDATIKLVEKEVREYSNNTIVYSSNPIPKNHLFANRCKLFDFYELTDCVVVYIK